MPLPLSPTNRSGLTPITRLLPIRTTAGGAQPQDFHETLRKLWRHRSIILACTILAGLASVGATYLIRPFYVAEAQVLIGVPEPRVFTTDQLLDGAADPNTEKVENERVAMVSRTLAQKVAERLDLARDPAFAPHVDKTEPWWQRLVARHLPTLSGSRAASPTAAPLQQPAATGNPAQTDHVIDALLSHIEVERMGRSQVLAIDAKAARPDLAAAIANTWASTYLQDARADRVATTNQVETYLSSRIGELRQQVEASDQAVEDYRRQYGLYRGTNASVTSQQLTELNTQLTLAQTAKAEADAKLREGTALQHDGVDGGSDPSVLDSHMIQTLKQQQAEAEQRLAELQSTFGDRYPTVVKAKAEVADIQRRLGVEVARTIDGLRNDAKTADLRLQSLQQNFAGVQKQMGAVNDKDIHLEALERDATVSRNLLQAMLNRAGETIGRQELEQPDAKMVSPAAPPEAPGFPPKKLIVLLGTLGGGLIGMLGALMRESGDRTFRSADEILETTGLPLIASVPNVGDSVPPAAYVLRHPVSPFSKSLRKIYIGTVLSGARNPPRTVLISSSIPAEGKSALAASLARLLAWNGKRVILIDCDYRSPTQHRIFQCSNQTGLASVMVETDPHPDAPIFNDAASGVDVLAAGNWTPRMAHMLASERMRRIVETFANHYDLVILDGPPVLAAAETLPLARMVDKTLFVVRWGHTKREAVHDALRQLADAQADLAGAVFTRVDPKRYRQFTYSNLNYEYVREGLS